jgi:hypothetical protein
MTTSHYQTVGNADMLIVSVGDVIEVGLQETTAGSHVSCIGTGAGATGGCRQDIIVGYNRQADARRGSGHIRERGCEKQRIPVGIQRGR